MNSIKFYQVPGLLLLVICCKCNGQHSFQKNDKYKNMGDGNINIEVVIEKMNDSLAIKYSVDNQGKHSVYLTDVYVKRTGTSMIVSENIIPMSYESGKVVFGSKLVSLNKSITSYAPPSTYATKVNGGARYAGLFKLSLPLKIVDREMPEPISETTHVKKAVFELGIVPDNESLQATLQKIGDKEVYLLNEQAWNLQFVYSKEFKGLELPMIILNY